MPGDSLSTLASITGSLWFTIAWRGWCRRSRGPRSSCSSTGVSMRFGSASAAAILFACLPGSLAAAQAPAAAASTTHAPYIARFKGATIGPDGSLTSTSIMVEAVDSHGRHYVSYSEGKGPGGANGPTNFQVSDPVSHTMSYWSIPGTKA